MIGWAGSWKIDL